MEERVLEIAEKTIKLSRDELLTHSKDIPEIDGYYFWDPKRGGLAVIVGKDGSKLGATSAISFQKHLEAYISGRRN